jgi:hypothetical protein
VCGDFVVRSAYLLSLVLVWVNVFTGIGPEGVFEKKLAFAAH